LISIQHQIYTHSRHREAVAVVVYECCLVTHDKQTPVIPRA
jgi:hypothetical protein